MKTSLSVLFVLATNAINAQTPQFAVVRPNGTTYICPTFDSAYTKAVNDDIIYIPGGNFTATNPISKRLHIYGAGNNPDSSYTTGITKLNALTILQGADNGTIEGILINNSSNPQTIASITFGDNLSSTPFSNYTISNCVISGGVQFLMPSTNITFKNNYIGFYGQYSAYLSIFGSFSNSLITNNIVGGNYIYSSNSSPNLEVDNNLFFMSFGNNTTYFSFSSNSNYRNNIFQSGPLYWNSTNSYFYNNTNGYPQGTGNISAGTVSETWDLTFINPGIPQTPYGYDVHNDYHVKPTSLCHNSGADGSDRGIYGGAFPWIEGSIPSNPHIYFKQVNTITNTNGQLPVQIKVRTGN